MKKKNAPKPQKLPAGIHGLRRPKKGFTRQLNVWLSEEERNKLEKAATRAGLSVSRFVMETALRAANRMLAEPKGSRPPKVKLPSSKKPRS